MANGLIATRTLDGSNPVLKSYFLTTGGSTFIGDPVEIMSDGKVQACSAASSGGEMVGVVAGLNKLDGSGEAFPLTFNLPTRGQIVQAGASGMAFVYSNPMQVYEAYVDGTCSTGMIGQNIDGSAGTPSSAAGRSGWILDETDINTTAPGKQFKVVGISPESIVNDGRYGPFGTAPIKLEVTILGGGLYNSRNAI